MTLRPSVTARFILETAMRSTFALTVAGSLAAALPFAQPALAAPDQTLGMALMAATVNQSGTLLRSTGAVSAERVSKGAYRVIFNREVISRCTYVANAETGPMPGGGFVKVDETISNTSSVLVYTYNAANAVEDRSFELIVVCSQ
jgi:hypothetical protein